MLYVDVENGKRWYMDYCALLNSSATLNANMIEKYGMYINNLDFYGIKKEVIAFEEPLEITLHEQFIFHILKCCVNLKKLRMIQSSLGETNLYVHATYRIQVHTDFLWIENCKIDDFSFAFKNLSKLIVQAKNLKLHGNVRVDGRYNQNGPLTSVDMTETAVGNLSFSNTSYRHVDGNEHEFLVNLSIGQGRMYYMYDLHSMSTLLFMPINKESYDGQCSLEGRFAISISCKSLANLKVKHKGKEIKLIVDSNK